MTLRASSRLGATARNSPSEAFLLGRLPDAGNRPRTRRPAPADAQARAGRPVRSTRVASAGALRAVLWDRSPGAESFSPPGFLRCRGDAKSTAGLILSMRWIGRWYPRARYCSIGGGKTVGGPLLPYRVATRVMRAGGGASFCGGRRLAQVGCAQR